MKQQSSMLAPLEFHKKREKEKAGGSNFPMRETECVLEAEGHPHQRKTVNIPEPRDHPAACS